MGAQNMIQAIVDEKKVIVTKTSVRRALQLKDAEGTECLPNATIFAKLERICAKTTAWNEFSSTMASDIICLATNQNFNFSKYIFDNMVKNLEAPEELGEGLEIPADPQHTPTIIKPSTSQPQKKQPRRKQRKDTKVPQPSGSTEPITDEATNKEHVHIHSNDTLLGGEDRLKLNELMKLCTNLSQRALDLENTKTSQAAEIATLKERVKKLERRNKSKTPRLKRLRKVGRTARIESSEDEGVFDEHEVKVKKVVSTAKVTIVSATPTTVNELPLAQTLIEIKAAKPKAVTTAATTTTTAVTRPKARGVVVQEPTMMEADYGDSETPEEEQGELTIEERSKLFVELMDKRKKHFAKLRAEEIRRKPPTKAQIRNQMCTYLKNMANYKHSQLKNKSFEEIQMLFDNTMKWVDSFVPMDTEVVERSKSQTEGSKKRTREELEFDNSKKQKIDENVKMDNPNITIEEYIRLEEEKARRRVNMPLLPSPKPTVSYFDDLDFFKDFENEFPAIVYNDAQTSKSDLLTEPTLSPQHIDEFNLKDETSLSECDEEEQNVLNFNDLFPFNIVYPDDLKSDKDNGDDKIDIEHYLGIYLSNRYMMY
ncbi:hypothetical protein Tco_1110004 [Tanacetum coccineum]|uniref:Uncharacterized protein n=1 Tax=Tanacetum coccineum TaxID=301880 RepID=A0ABQ5IHK1_9ASTR